MGPIPAGIGADTWKGGNWSRYLEGLAVVEDFVEGCHAVPHVHVAANKEEEFRQLHTRTRIAREAVEQAATASS